MDNVRKKILDIPNTICIEKIVSKNGRQIDDSKISFRGRIYNKLSEQGNKVCYIITNNRI